MWKKLWLCGSGRWQIFCGFVSLHLVRCPLKRGKDIIVIVIVCVQMDACRTRPVGETTGYQMPIVVDQSTDHGEPNSICFFTTISTSKKCVFQSASWKDIARHIAGLEVNFSVHLQSLSGNIFSISKLVRSLANYFQMFGRHGWF